MANYHHGDLRRAVMDRALEIIASAGPDRVSLRAIAADLGVSHTAPRHHVGSRDGLLTAIAAEGFELLAEAMAATREGGGTFLDVGVAYVDFGLDHAAHFAVMFTPDLLLEEDEDLARARARAFAELRGGVDAMSGDGRVEDARAAVVAGWSLVHGLTTLVLTGNLAAAGLGEGPHGVQEHRDLARRTAGMLFGSPG